MFITTRQQFIFLEILKENNILLRNISENLKIAEKTISKEIQKLNMFLLKYDTKVLVSHKSGISIDSIYSSRELFDIIKENQKLSQEDELISILLFNQIELSQAVLCDSLYCSRSTLLKLIKNINYLPLTKSRNGYLLNIDMGKRIDEIINIIAIYIDNINFKSTLKNIFLQLNLEVYDQLFQIDVDKYIDDEKIILYTDESIKLYYLFLVLKKYFKYKGDNKKILRYKKIEYKDLLVNHVNLYNICFNQLSVYLEIKKEDIVPLVNHIVMLSNIQKKYNQVENYIYWKQLKEFNKSYPLAVEIAKQVINSLSNNKTFYLDDIEIYYISLHIQSLIQKKKELEKKNIIIVCEYGVGLSNFLVSKLEKKLNENVEIEAVALNEYRVNENEYKDFDLIVTTILNFNSKYKSIYISPFLNDQEITLIYQTLAYEENKKIFNQIINEESIITLKSFKNNHELYQYINKLINPSNKKYMDSLITRCERGNIVVDGVLIPHGNPNFVKYNKTYFIKLEDKYQVDNIKVEYIIINYWNKEFIKKNLNFIKEFYKRIISSEVLRTVYVNDTKETLKNLLKKMEE